ncbi:MAG: hypothetical protein KDK00_05420, partial [Rhodobacteraceae bacterium]|nr:hypothetical protein [Paracoccaceae bacterium]
FAQVCGNRTSDAPIPANAHVETGGIMADKRRCYMNKPGKTLETEPVSTFLRQCFQYHDNTRSTISKELN